MSFNAAKAYQDVRAGYLRNIIDFTMGSFPNAGDDEDVPRWRAIREQLQRDWSSDNPETALLARPVVEPMFPYEGCGLTIDQLIQDHTLHERMHSFVDEGLANGSYQLYAHPGTQHNDFDKWDNYVNNFSVREMCDKHSNSVPDR